MSIIRKMMDKLIAATHDGIDYARTERAHDRLCDALDELIGERDMLLARVVQLETKMRRIRLVLNGGSV